VSTDARITAVRARLAESGLAAFAANASANVAYLTGFEGVFDDEPASVALLTPDALAVYTDARYVEVLTAAASGTPWDVRLVRESLWHFVAGDVAEICGEGRLGVETSVSVGTFRQIEKELPDRVEAVENWVEHARRVKDSAEIERIVAAQMITDAAFEYILEVIGSGVTERQVALDLEVFMRSHGSDGLAFKPIVAGGPNSSKPHAVPADRTIVPGDFVVLDFGARVDGYCADMTRTIVVGAASDRQRDVYDAVRAANEAGIKAISADVSGAEADAAARGVLVDRGLGDAFTHGLGHGVGREVHEMPTVSAKGTEKLQAGEVVTVEPGAYVPGFGGVRIEDLVVVEATGCRVLTTSTKDLIEV
jgi:Xaa-Pro aminopeptidase